MESSRRVAVVALGGNAISNASEPDTIANQFAHTRKSMGAILELIRAGYSLAITHGNGPQVGNALLRVELSHSQAPMVPLGVLVADTEGSMGYMIEQSLQNALLLAGIERQVVTVVTQVLVKRDDPSLLNPTKFIGQYYSEAEARERADRYGWEVKNSGKYGWRRVVGSPHPLQIINRAAVKHLLEQGMIVIAAGGGGIPVYYEADGRLEGVDAVIDKDRASAVLGRDIGAELLIMLTDIDRVYIDFGRLDQQPLEKVTVSEMEQYLKQGQFPPGNMGPKVEAAVNFILQGGEKVIIASLDQVLEALQGKAGTWVVKDGI